MPFERPQQDFQMFHRYFSRLSKFAFFLAAILFASLLLRSILSYEVYIIDTMSITLAFGVPAIGLVTSVSLALAGPGLRNNFFLLALFIVIPLYGIEAYLGKQGDTKRYQDIVEAFTKKRGAVYDSRTPLEVIHDKRRTEGRDLHASQTISNIPFHSEKTGTMFLRGSASNRTILGGNESGTYVFYESDEFGFKNPKGIWNSGGVSLVAVGDSFTHATSVPPKDDIIGVIRESYPKSLNLGWNGIGPIYYYQNLLEYGSVLKPKYALYVWFEGNDALDLLEEAKTPLLAKYIGRTEPLGLHGIQEQIDRYHLSRLAKTETGGAALATLERVRQFVMAYNVRKFLGIGAAGSRHPIILDKIAALWGKGNDGHPPLARETFQTLLSDAKVAVSGWGGTFLFVYLPSWERLCGNMPDMKDHCPPLSHDFRRKDVLDVVEKLGIETIDMVPVFESGQSLDQMFYFPGSHYSVKGYRKVAETIVRRLRKLETTTTR